MICSNKLSRGSFDDNELNNLAVYPNTFCPSITTGNIPLECCRSPITGISDVELDSSYFTNFPELPALQNEITNGSQFQDVFKHCSKHPILPNNTPTDNIPIDQTKPIPQTKQYIRMDLLVMIIIFILLYFASK